MIDELLGAFTPADWTLGGLLSLVVFCIVMGWLVPKKGHEQALSDKDKQIDRANGEKDRLHDAVDGIRSDMGTLAGAVEDLKVSNQASLYAMQEIQAAYRYAIEQRKAPES